MSARPCFCAVLWSDASVSTIERGEVIATYGFRIEAENGAVHEERGRFGIGVEGSTQAEQGAIERGVAAARALFPALTHVHVWTDSLSMVERIQARRRRRAVLITADHVRGHQDLRAPGTGTEAIRNARVDLLAEIARNEATLEFRRADLRRYEDQILREPANAHVLARIVKVRGWIDDTDRRLARNLRRLGEIASALPQPHQREVDPRAHPGEGDSRAT